MLLRVWIMISGHPRSDVESSCCPSIEANVRAWMLLRSEKSLMATSEVNMHGLSENV